MNRRTLLPLILGSLTSTTMIISVYAVSNAYYNKISSLKDLPVISEDIEQTSNPDTIHRELKHLPSFTESVEISGLDSPLNDVIGNNDYPFSQKYIVLEELQSMLNDKLSALGLKIPDEVKANILESLIENIQQGINLSEIDLEQVVENNISEQESETEQVTEPTSTEIVEQTENQSETAESEPLLTIPFKPESNAQLAEVSKLNGQVMQRYTADINSIVYSIDEGEVLHIENDYILIIRDDATTAVYATLSAISVKVGDRIKNGTQLGIVGSYDTNLNNTLIYFEPKS